MQRRRKHVERAGHVRLRRVGRAARAVARRGRPRDAGVRDDASNPYPVRALREPRAPAVWA